MSSTYVPMLVKESEHRVVPSWPREMSLISIWLILLAVTALWLTGGGLQELARVSGSFTSLGRLSGLISSALLLIQVFLMARIPLIEQAWGQDALIRVHRVIGFSSFVLMGIHIVLITVGYSAADTEQIWPTIVDFTLNYPGMLLAIAGTASLIMVVVTSARAARRRLRYESWHLIHLYAYVGVGLALPHQLWTGQEFMKSPVITAFWWGLYIVCAGAVVVFRVLLPLWKSLRYPLRVESVYRDGRDALSVTVYGNGVDKLKAQGGQFFQWRFLGLPGWTRAHPFSLSAAPGNARLRFTAKIVGDGTAQLLALRPGSRVLVEGPYGRMHPGVRTQRRVLLLGAGIGITPMRALLESLPQNPGDVMIINRIHSYDTAVLSEEIAFHADQRGAQYRVLEGPRNRSRDSWLPETMNNWDDTHALTHLCPDIATRDVYICGPTPWIKTAISAVHKAGTPTNHIHSEHFSY